jgi:hypothetical protein
MFKGLSGIESDELFERAYDSRTQGHSLKLKKQYCRKDIRKFCFSERVGNRWNVTVTMVNLFKAKLQRIRLLKRSFYTDTWCPTRGFLLLVWPHQLGKIPSKKPMYAGLRTEAIAQTLIKSSHFQLSNMACSR